MKKLILLAIFLISGAVKAQENIEENSPKQLVISFFEAFHAKDTVQLKSFALVGLKLQSVSTDS